MKREVKRLPNDAVYDFTDIMGIKHYHTDRKRYEVEYKVSFGIGYSIIYSYNITNK